MDVQGSGRSPLPPPQSLLAKEGAAGLPQVSNLPPRNSSQPGVGPKLVPLPPSPQPALGLCPRSVWFGLCLGQAKGKGAPQGARISSHEGRGRERGQAEVCFEICFLLATLELPRGWV